MRRLALLFALILPAAAAAQSPEGVWRTEASDSGAYLHVRIAPCAGGGGTLCGEIVETVGAPPDADLAGRTIIQGMAPSREGRWSGGTIWAPDDDRTYRSNMRLQGDRLRVEGCVLVLCRDQSWTRLR